ncbi:MAG: hypothetical protein WAZ12_01800 [Candidatus Absconditicoccaceae bacterium]
MSFYNLSSYVKYGLFLQDIRDNNPYDLIVFERKFQSDLDVLKFNIKFLDQDDDSFSKQINTYLDNYSDVLLILDESNSYDALGGLQLKGNLTIINLHVGISGLGNKNKLDGNDISYLLNLGFEVYEPRDMNNFTKILLTQGNKYLRLNNNDLPQNLMYFKDFAIIDQKVLESKNMLSLVNNGFSGFDGAVVVSGSLLENAIQALRISSENHGYSFDLFCMSNLDIGLDNDLIESLKKHGFLIIIVDQSYPNGYQDYIRLKFKEKGHESVRIKFIYPEYDKLNTVMEEYKFEQVGLDGLSIANKIQNIMKS